MIFEPLRDGLAHQFVGIFIGLWLRRPPAVFLGQLQAPESILQPCGSIVPFHFGKGFQDQFAVVRRDWFVGLRGDVPIGAGRTIARDQCPGGELALAFHVRQQRGLRIGKNSGEGGDGFAFARETRA